jgi:glycosyltransferase involved in cell wall biosynthesis
VSVIIPAFDAERYLAEALQSVLQQSRPADEIIVIDDGSTDGTEQVVNGSDGAITYCRQTRSGAAAARNHGVRLATGSFLTFLDADDTWMPTKLELQLAAFERDANLDIVFGRVVQFRSPDVERTSFAAAEGMGAMDGCHPGTMMVGRATFDAVGPFDEEHEVGDFIDWYARALEQRLSIRMLPEVAMRRRFHGANMGRRNYDRRDEYARVLRTVIHRRRHAGP